MFVQSINQNINRTITVTISERKHHERTGKAKTPPKRQTRRRTDKGKRRESEETRIRGGEPNSKKANARPRAPRGSKRCPRSPRGPRDVSLGELRSSSSRGKHARSAASICGVPGKPPSLCGCSAASAETRGISRGHPAITAASRGAQLSVLPHRGVCATPWSLLVAKPFFVVFCPILE